MTDVTAQILAGAATLAVGLVLGFLIAYARRRLGRIVAAALSVLTVAGVALLPQLSVNEALGAVLYLVGLTVGAVVGFRTVAWPAPASAVTPPETV